MAASLCALGLASLLLALCMSRSCAQASYKLVDLGIGEAMHVNEAGTVVGFRWISNAPFPFIWDAARGLRFLPVPSGCTATPFCVNKYNEAVGTMGTPNRSVQCAFCISETETATDMNTLLSPADHAIWDLQVATCINDEGIVVGYGDKDGVQTGWMMDMSTSPVTITSLDCAGFSISTPNWINQSCLIVGDHNPTNSFMLPMGGQFAAIPITNANGVNDNGDIVGRIYVSGIGYQAAFLPNGTTAATLIGSLGYWSISNGVNLPTNGRPITVVGRSGQKSASADYHGFRWQVGGKITDLTTLVSNLPNRKWYIHIGCAVNGSGTIAGQASDGTLSSTGSNYHAIVLIP